MIGESVQDTSNCSDLVQCNTHTHTHAHWIEYIVHYICLHERRSGDIRLPFWYSSPPEAQTAGMWSCRVWARLINWHLGQRDLQVLWFTGSLSMAGWACWYRCQQINLAHTRHDHILAVRASAVPKKMANVPRLFFMEAEHELNVGRAMQD